MEERVARRSKGFPVKRFADLTEQEVLALAITNEEEDSRIYRGFAEGLREQFPSSAKVFDEMAEEERLPGAPRAERCGWGRHPGDGA